VNCFLGGTNSISEYSFVLWTTYSVTQNFVLLDRNCEGYPKVSELERGLQVVQLSATKHSCSGIL
jgi:hypothetical protein